METKVRMATMNKRRRELEASASMQIEPIEQSKMEVDVQTTEDISTEVAILRHAVKELIFRLERRLGRLGLKAEL
jgi:hypothetical protein